MNQTHRNNEAESWRYQRSHGEENSQTLPPSIIQMESTMFEAMRKLGGYRVDYLNKDRMGSPNALGFYVLGDLPAKQAYSHSAKHSLLAGLIMLRNLSEIDNLVAIYLDVNQGDNAPRSAYLRMKQDMQSGMFRRLFVLDPRDLAGDSQTAQDWWNFSRQLERFEVVSLGAGQLSEIPDIMLTMNRSGISQERSR